MRRDRHLSHIVFVGVSAASYTDTSAQPRRRQAGGLLVVYLTLPIKCREMEIRVRVRATGDSDGLIFFSVWPRREGCGDVAVRA